VRLGIAQLDPTAGDVAGNLAKAADVLADLGGKADLVVLPELYLTGYPPRDLLLKPSFLKKVESAVAELARLSRERPATAILVGAPTRTGRATGAGLWNAALLVRDGEVSVAQRKSLLPAYDVFDETRYFDAAGEVSTVPLMGEVLGASVCEDAWNDPEFLPRPCYDRDPVAELARAGATLLVNISASPFHAGKGEERMRLAAGHAARHGLPFAYVNQVGGTDDLVFDGGSMFVDAEGLTVELMPSFEEAVTVVDTKARGRPGAYSPPDRTETVHDALVLGIRDYMRKCGFSKAVVGLSGGIDSAVTCCLAARAAGRENVLGVSMPSPYSSPESAELARRLASNLSVEFKLVPISGIYRAYVSSLGTELGLRDEVDLTLENVQARIRGQILMAISNRYGHLLLSTGNKSELAVGYCTLYGDLAGGLAAISDVPKQMVYALARFINRETEVIPREIIERAPSAELRPGQTDQDALPPYETLDTILERYVERQLSAEEIAREGFDEETVRWVVTAVDRSEYKRRQAPPGLKVTTKAFGTGRRMPIAARLGG
jgi:NAD+ synthase (glutamine-hydrolysing)